MPHLGSRPAIEITDPQSGRAYRLWLDDLGVSYQWRLPLWGRLAAWVAASFCRSWSTVWAGIIRVMFGPSGRASVTARVDPPSTTDSTSRTTNTSGWSPPVRLSFANVALPDVTLRYADPGPNFAQGPIPAKPKPGA